VRQLILTVRKHMENEERELFPLLRSVVEHTQLVQVGEAIVAARDADRGVLRA
jgi:hypothetical protein